MRFVGRWQTCKTRPKPPLPTTRRRVKSEGCGPRQVPDGVTSRAPPPQRAAAVVVGVPSDAAAGRSPAPCGSTTAAVVAPRLPLPRASPGPFVPPVASASAAPFVVGARIADVRAAEPQLHAADARVDVIGAAEEAGAAPAPPQRPHAGAATDEVAISSRKGSPPISGVDARSTKPSAMSHWRLELPPCGVHAAAYFDRLHPAIRSHLNEMTSTRERFATDRGIAESACGKRCSQRWLPHLHTAPQQRCCGASKIRCADAKRGQVAADPRIARCWRLPPNSCGARRLLTCVAMKLGTFRARARRRCGSCGPRRRRAA